MKLKSPIGEIVDIPDVHSAIELQSPAHGYVRVSDDDYGTDMIAVKEKLPTRRPGRPRKEESNT